METTVVIGIMTIVMMLLSQIFTMNYDFTMKQLGRNDDDAGAIFAMRRLGEVTRGAVNVETSHVISGTTYDSSSDVLVLKLPSMNASGDIIFAAYDYVAVFRDATTTKIIRTDTEADASSVRPDGKKLLTAYNDTMTFSYNDPIAGNATRVSVYLVNKQVVRGQTLMTRAWTSVFLRNH